MSGVIMGVHKPDGSLTWISINSRPLVRDGELYAAVTSFVDVTDQKQAEHCRKATEERWKLAIEGARDGIWDWDAKTDEVFFSPRWKEILGYEDSEIGSTRSEWEDRIHPDDKPSTTAALNAHLAGKSPLYEAEYRLKCKDGSWKWVFARGAVVSRDGGAKPLRFVGAHTDITDRKRAEEALRASEEQFRALAESSLIGVYVNQDDRYTYVNPAMAGIFGYRPDEMVGLGALEIIQPCDHALVSEMLRRRWAGEVKSVQYEFQGRRKDGSTRNVQVYGSRVEMDGRPAIVGTLEDITERKRAADALRDSEARFRATFMKGADAFYIATFEDGRAVDVNDAFVALSGYPREELIGHSSLELRLYANPTDRTRLVAELNAKGRVTNFETIGKKKSGEQFLASISAVSFKLGGVLHIAGALRDITEVKRAEAALRESEVRLNEAARLAGVGFASWDAKTNTTTWSEQMYRIFGRDPSLLPPGISERSNTYTPESWARLKNAFRRVTETGETVDLEVDVVREDGAIRHTEAHLGAAARDEFGCVVRVYGTLHDITERRLAEERLQQTQKSETLALLSRGIAHDFNNLIGAILAQVELILMDTPAGMAGSDELRRIEGLARRASEIVRQLMIYSGQELPAIGPVDLSGLVDEILELLNISISKNATIRAELEKGLPAVMADAAQLRQVIMNLVLNASDAIGAGPGVITVTTSRRSAERSQETSLPAGDYLRLEVSDTGCGMSEEVRARIFEPFYSTKGDGRGLGLATTQAIVRGNGGFINVASAPGQGTQFELLLPCTTSRPQTGEPAITRMSLQIAGAPHTVLMVEDQDALRVAAAKILCRRGFVVLQAADGNTAVDLLQSAKQVDVILLDVTIPGITSHDVMTQAEVLHPQAKVLLTTAYSREMVMGSFEGAHISGFIRKPYRLGELLEMVQGLLPA